MTYDKLCPDCGVHPNLCVCASCETITGAPGITVLQHPSEVSRHKGTLRIVRACLPHLAVVRGEAAEDFAEFATAVEPPRTGLLFPCEGSRPLEEANARAGVDHWLVLDGTWRKAKRLYFSNPWLNELPAFHFATPPRSTYRIRKSPREDGLATAEAVRYLLATVAPEVNHQALTRAMQALVEAELAQIPAHLHHRYQ